MTEVKSDKYPYIIIIVRVLENFYHDKK